MEVCFFLLCHDEDTQQPPLPFDPSQLAAVSHATAGLRRFVSHTPLPSAHCDPLSKTNAAAPRCVLQWYFDDLDALEQALQPGSAIHSVVERSTRPAQEGLAFMQQAMAVRTFATPGRDAGDHVQRCTYLVSYEGEADDFNAWLTHYMTHHPPLMAQLPGIRELEIYTRLDYRSALGIERATAMQRNKVVFDAPESLAAALASPIRARMKQDFNAFPPYRGPTLHFPMRSIYGNLKPK